MLKRFLEGRQKYTTKSSMIKVNANKMYGALDFEYKLVSIAKTIGTKQYNKVITSKLIPPQLLIVQIYANYWHLI